MANELAQCLSVFRKAAVQNVAGPIDLPSAIYTIARGSSDAAANILSYEFMRELGLPMTSMPPSVFSLGNGVGLRGATILVISQSGASHDLIFSARGAVEAGARVIALTNQANSPVEAAAHLTVRIGAGPELAVPATKSVVGAIAGGMALLACMKQSYQTKVLSAVETVTGISMPDPQASALEAAFLRARNVYVIGRDTGYGAAQEVALKLKECCAIHAEAYSSSEVLHGPLQLAINPLMVLILDTGQAEIQDSLDQAEARFRSSNCDLHRVRLLDLGASDLSPAAAAAVLLTFMYSIVLNTALNLGFDPDKPEVLSKVTQTT